VEIPPKTKMHQLVSYAPEAAYFLYHIFNSNTTFINCLKNPNSRQLFRDFSSFNQLIAFKKQKHISTEILRNENKSGLKRKGNYQVNDIDADITSFNTLDGNQQYISRIITWTLIVHNFMPIRILNIHRFTPNLRWVRRRRIIRYHLYCLILVYLKSDSQPDYAKSNYSLA
jgi:hypothetical protein